MTRLLRTLVLTLALSSGSTGALVATTASAASAAAQDTTAVAINTHDGASVFRLAFHVVRVVNGVVDQGNAAAAVSSCTDCQTVALAFQVVLVMGDASTVTPTNLAIAYNQDCSYCVTYAAATQIVLGTDGIVRLSPEGQRRLNELRQRLRTLQGEELTLNELEAAVAAARTELKAIFATELLPAGPPDGASATASGEASTTTTTTTSTSAQGSSTTTTIERTTTTTSAPASTTTTTSSTTTSSPSTTTSAP